MVKVYQRRTGQVVEPTEYKSGLLDKLYGTAWGRFLLPILTRPSLSYLLTLKDYTPFSCKKIAAFVENYQLNLADYEDGPYPSFAALPAVLLMTQLPLGAANIVLAVLYVLAAVTRLAHFNRLAKHDEGSGSYFIGLPVTYSALFFPLTYLVCQWLAPGLYAWVWLGLSLLLSFLFVYNCRIPKPNKLSYLAFAILAVVSLIGLGVLPHG